MSAAPASPMLTLVPSASLDDVEADGLALYLALRDEARARIARAIQERDSLTA